MNNTFNLWKNPPGIHKEIPTISVHIPNVKKSNGAVVIFPGGGYVEKCEHEGIEYAKYLNENGICAFVCNYRVSPHKFPLELLDARRAIRFVRYNAEKYKIDKNKIAVMGSSAGGHLAALASTFFDDIDFEDIDEIDNECCVPNAQILCYPVIKLSLDEKEAHIDSAIKLLGTEQLHLAHRLTPQNIVSNRTPKCFMWHTFNDDIVPVGNSIDYAKALKRKNISCEMHIFPDGYHGLGLANSDDIISKHTAQWKKLMMNWLEYIGF